MNAPHASAAARAEQAPVVRRGRARGLGVTLITQRPAVIAKDVLTQIEVLIALRMTAPHDRDAVKRWIETNGTGDERNKVLASLNELPIGTAWLSSPGWLGTFCKVRVRARRTFDSSATPAAGIARAAPRALASVDLDALRERMQAAAVELAEPELAVPRALHRADRAGARRAPTDAPAPSAPEPLGEHIAPAPRDGSSAAALRALEHRAGDAANKVRALTASVAAMQRELADLRAALADRPRAPPRAAHRVRVVDYSQQVPLPAQPARAAPVPSLSSSSTSGPAIRAGERRMLGVLADFDPKRLTRQQLATLSEFTVSGGTFGAYLGTLRRLGAVVEAGELVGLTDDGRAYAREHLGARTRVTRASVIERWNERLRLGERNMLAAVLEDGETTRAELAAGVGMEASGGTFGAYLGTLRRNGLVEVRGTRVTIGEALKAWGAAK